MKRRKFITSAIGSVCVINIPSLPIWIYENIQKKWFEFFLKTLNAKKSNRLLSLDLQLQKTYQKTIQNWLQTGCKSLDTNFYIFENNNLALFPVVFEVAGTLDISALCFAKNTAGLWQPISHLTGFHFEAFQLFTQTLKETLDSNYLADAFLPYFQQNLKNH